MPQLTTEPSSRAAAATVLASARSWSSRPGRKKNYIDNTVTEQASIIRFIEDTFLERAQRIGNGSADSVAGSLMNMFNFTSTVTPNPNVVLLSPTSGAVTSGN